MGLQVGVSVEGLGLKAWVLAGFRPQRLLGGKRRLTDAGFEAFRANKALGFVEVEGFDFMIEGYGVYRWGQTFQRLF